MPLTQEAYGVAFQQGFDRTVRLLCSRGARSECARETAQAAWARGWERIHQLRNGDVVTSWVNTIALNYYRATVRNEQRQVPLAEPVSGNGVNLAAIDLERILMSCRPSDRQLFESYLQGDATEEIAKNQGISCTALRIRILRARRAMRTRVLQTCAKTKSLRAHA